VWFMSSITLRLVELLAQRETLEKEHKPQVKTSVISTDHQVQKVEQESHGSMNRADWVQKVHSLLLGRPTARLLRPQQFLRLRPDSEWHVSMISSTVLSVIFTHPADRLTRDGPTAAQPSGLDR